jgi:competence protein ComEA
VLWNWISHTDDFAVQTEVRHRNFMTKIEPLDFSPARLADSRALELENYMTLKRALAGIMSVVFLVSTTQMAYAQDFGLLSDIKPPQQASEYIFRSSPKESLISVQLLGAVNKPGIYYIPANTDLLKLLTLAGGSTNGGDISEILVRKAEPKAWSDVNTKAVNEYQGGYEVDAEKILKYGGSRQLKLAQDDFVYVPPRTPWISSEASRNITVFSVVLGIVLTGLLIQKYDNN